MNGVTDNADMGSAEATGMAASQEFQRPRTAVIEAAPPGNVDRIRDILFGSQMREYENRFARLEETLLRETADVKETTRKRFDALEAYVKKELESLQARWKTERDERSDALRLLAREVSDLADTLGKKIREVDDQVSEAHGQLRTDILEQSKNLNEEMQRKHDEISGALERRFQDLRNEKTDRAMLADMLTEVALRLKNEFRMPAAAGG